MLNTPTHLTTLPVIHAARQVADASALVLVRSQPISPPEGNEAAGGTFLTEEPGHEGLGAAFLAVIAPAFRAWPTRQIPQHTADKDLSDENSDGFDVTRPVG